MAHRETQARVSFTVDATIEADEVIPLGDRTLCARFTPGHAPGHLAFLCPEEQVVYAGDLVAGEGTILVDPSDDEDIATGRFVLLHDPSEPEPWSGAWRVVTFARAELEAEVASDPMLGAVGWSWLTDALESHGIEPINLAGTVTRVVSESFGDLDDREPDVDMEIRASWTPAGPAVGVHLEAWVDMLGTVGGLPPLPSGVVALPGRRR